MHNGHVFVSKPGFDNFSPTVDTGIRLISPAVIKEATNVNIHREPILLRLPLGKAPAEAGPEPVALPGDSVLRSTLAVAALMVAGKAAVPAFPCSD